MRPEHRPLFVAVIVGVAASVIAWAVTRDARIGMFAALACALFLIVYFFVLPWIRTFRFRRLLDTNPTGILAVYGEQSEAEQAIRRLALSAKAIDVLTIRGFGLVGLKDAILRSATDRPQDPPNTRVLILNPKSGFAEQRAREIGETTVVMRRGIESTIRTILALKENSPRWDIRLYANAPIWRIIRIDDDLFVSTYPLKQDGHRSLMYHIHNGPQLSLYPSFARYFEAIWDAAAKPGKSLGNPS